MIQVVCSVHNLSSCDHYFLSGNEIQTLLLNCQTSKWLVSWDTTVATRIKDPVRTAPLLRVQGQLHKFKPGSDDFSTYLECIQLYFDTNSRIAHCHRRQSLHNPSQFVCSHLKSFTELLEALESHNDPKPLVTSQRFVFYQCCQKPNGSIADFLAGWASSVNFMTSWTRHSEPFCLQNQRQGHSEEAAGWSETHRLVQRTFAGAGRKQHLFRCVRKHAEHECKFRHAQCHKCGKAGHIAPVCMAPKMTSHLTQKNPPPPPFNKGRVEKPRILEEVPGARLQLAYQGDQGAYSLFTFHGPRSPITVPFCLSGKEMDIKLDTGATITIMSRATLFQDFPFRGQVWYWRHTMEVMVRDINQDHKPQELPLVIRK